MKEKAIFVFSFICMIISVLFSFFVILNSFVFLKGAEKTTYSDEDVCNVTEEKSGGIYQKENIADAAGKVLADLENKKESLGEFKITAYCSCEKCCGKWASNRPKDENGKDIVYGSTGEVLIVGTSVAVDPSVIPYGSQVEINGHTYTAQDTGSAIKGNRIDVYFDGHQDALNFGVQYAEVFLIGGKQ